MAGMVQYIGQGRQSPAVNISYSINNGASWQNKALRPGQTIYVSREATHLNINGVPTIQK